MVHRYGNQTYFVHNSIKGTSRQQSFVVAQFYHYQPGVRVVGFKKAEQ